MGEEYKKVGEYKVKEVYNEEGQKIQDVLAEIFRSYCKENMEKEVFGQTFLFYEYRIIIIIYLWRNLLLLEGGKIDTK